MIVTLKCDSGVILEAEIRFSSPLESKSYLPLHIVTRATKHHETVSSQFIEDRYKITVLWAKINHTFKDEQE